MRRLVLAAALFACTHAAPKPAAPQPAAGPSRDELSRVAVRVAPETLVNDPVLKDRGAELRTALAKALADEGFRVADDPAALTVTTSIDYTPWTSLSASSLYVVVGLKHQGDAVDQVEVQKVNEAFPEPAKVGELAHSLAHSLATSPRLRDWLHPAAN